MSLKPIALLFALLFAVLGTPATHAAAICAPNNVLATPTSDFTINGNGTVTHLKTGLMWKQCAEGLTGASCNAGGAMSTATLMNWSAALAVAAPSAGGPPFAGYSDWRLPNQKELLSIVETGCHAPSINETAFPNTPVLSAFWSSTSYAPSPTNAWFVHFNDVSFNAYEKYHLQYVRLVRDGQPFDYFDAKKKAQAIVFGTAPTLVVGSTGTVNATGGPSPSPVIFSSLSSGICTISGGTVIGVAVGFCTIAANQGGNFQYNAAAQVMQSFNVDKGNQTISFGMPPSIVVDGTGVVSAFATSGLAVSKSSLTPVVCTISGNTVTGITVGTCTIAGDRHSDANYYAAPQATQSFSIGKGSQVIVFGTPPELAVGATNTVNATGGASGNAVVFTSTTLSMCTVSAGNTVTGLLAGTCIIAANQASSANYNAAPQATQSFSVGQGNQIIVFDPAPTVLAGYTGTVSANGGASGNPVTFSSTTTGVCTASGNTVTGLTLGTCTIAADQAGNTNYYPAPQVLQSLVLLDPGMHINDTGQDTCWDGTALVACSAANSGNAAAYPRQDGRFGRDAAAAAGQLNKLGSGDKGFDYTRVCMSGEVAGQGACPVNPVQGTGVNQWACTRDNVTHRLWSLDSIANNWSYGNTIYPAAMNASGRCGFNTGWRMPTRRELFSIVNNGRWSPAIDAVYFPATSFLMYWSADPFVNAPGSAWYVEFTGGGSAAVLETNNHYIRLVHGGQ